MTNQISNILKYVLVAAVVAFISFLFPSQQQLRLDYQIGERWERETLVAPFDFPILKSEEALEAEKQDLMKDFYPYFVRDTGVKEEVFESILAQINSYAASDTSVKEGELDRLRQLSLTILDEIYERGIIETEYPEAWDRPYLHIVEGRTMTLTSKEDLLKPENARNIARSVIRRADVKEGSALFAIISEEVQPNIRFNQDLTDRYLQAEMEKISPAVGKVSKGEIVINKGDIVTQEDLITLRSYEAYYSDHASKAQGKWELFVGYLILTILLIGVLLFYLQVHYRKVFARFSSLAFMLFWTVIFSYLVFVIERTDNISTYIIPFCIVPIVVKNFYNDSLALYVHLVIVLIASFLSKLGYEFTFLQLLAGIVTVLVVKETRFWSKFFASILFIFITYALGYFALSLLETGDLAAVDWSMYIWFLLSGVLTLLAYPLIPLLERIFGYTSSITLAELNDLNNPLLRDLSVKAPGTMQHSIQVANLAEAVADQIGANSLLVRVGALYHDIGKMKEPLYFIENQSGSNPHDDLNEKESAEKIINHVTAGARMARKRRLPKVIVDFILTHHGTTRVEYFYRTYVKEHPDEEVDESLFRYPGPKPSSREQAIVMLADSVEAASKSLKNPAAGDIEELVDNVTEGKIKMGQLEQAELTFSEFETTRKVLKKMLKSINHVRIEYPEEVNPEIRK